MTQSSTAPLLRRRFSFVLLMLAAVTLLGSFSFAQMPDRIAPSFTASDTTPLKASLHPLARAEYDRGRVSGITKVPLMTLVFTPSAAQQAALTALLAAQQNPASPSYHKWLTPAQFGAQFGMSQQDTATTEAWLQAQGFTVLSVASGRNFIQFSGTAAQAEAAFHTEMHQYQVNGTMHLANSSALALPSALAGAVAGIRGLSQFPPHPMHTPVRRSAVDSLKPQFTSSVTGNHFLAPNDITTMYDIKALYNAGYTGTGQNIAIVGESAIATSDIDAFRAAAGLAAKEPTIVLVPNTGASTIQSSTGDEDESDIDLEWSNAIAPNANVYFLYAGANGDVFDALRFAISPSASTPTVPIIPIISISYGECEPEAASDPSTFEPLFMEANAQGQTILASSGDAGATACDTGLDSSGAVAGASQGLALSYPASSSFITGMGGTELNEGSTNYWNTTNDSGGGSAISYIPEIAWNETTASEALTPPGGFSSTGGGQSILFSKPSWQVATGVPNDGARDLPDISLDAAAIHDGLLYCDGYCTNGFRYSDETLTSAGGTSFDAPIFAGILTLINQKNGSTGAGNINPDLYALYATAPTAFHDITAGNNEQPCTSGTTDCPAGTTEIGYTAGAGYDETTGLGSIDAYNLALVFPAATTVTTAPLLVSSTAVTAPTYGPAVGTSITFTATVSVAAATAAPTGTVTFTITGTNPATSAAIATVAGTGSTATATYTTTFTTMGSDSVTATYSGDATNAGSTSSPLAITVGTTTAPAPSFTIAATNVTVASGSSASSTVTTTSLNGYAGTVDFTYTTSAGFNGCLLGNSSQRATTNGTVTTAVTVDTLTTDCVSTGERHLMTKTAAKAMTSSRSQHQGPWPSDREYPIAAAAVLAGLILLGRKRPTWPAAMILMLAGLGTLGVLSGCGGSSSGTTTTSGTPKGTYTITLTGTDSSNNNLTSTTTFSVTVD